MRFVTNHHGLIIALIGLCLQAPATLDAQGQRQGGKTQAQQTTRGAQPAKERPSNFERAEALLKEGKFQEAITAYRQSLEDYPDNEAAHFGMALAQSQAGMTQEAIQSYEAALRINPKLWEAETNLGVLWTNQQQFDRALPHFQKAQELNPKSFQISYLLARTHEALGQLQQAAAHYRQALALAETPAEKFEVHTSLGHIGLKMQSWSEAEEHLLAAKQLPGDTSTLDLDLARLYFQTGKYDRCVDLLQPLAERQPGDAELQELLGRAYAKTAAYDKAVRFLEAALTPSKNPAQRQSLSLELARVYQELGQDAKAIELLQQVAASSTDSKLLFHLGALQLQRRLFDPALQSFMRALQLDPGCVDCYSNLGSIFMLQEKYPEAISAFARYKAARPEVPGTYFYMGLAFDKLNDVENAFAHYQKFLTLDQGKSDKQGFQARERMKVLEKRLKKR